LGVLAAPILVVPLALHLNFVRLADTTIVSGSPDVFPPDAFELMVRSHFGRDAVGLDAAARKYFVRTSSELTREGLAQLIAATHAPSHLDPWCGSDRNKQRANRLLGRDPATPISSRIIKQPTGACSMPKRIESASTALSIRAPLLTTRGRPQRRGRGWPRSGSKAEQATPLNRRALELRVP
jgi:hypothetical protein